MQRPSCSKRTAATGCANYHAAVSSGRLTPGVRCHMSASAVLSVLGSVALACSTPVFLSQSLYRHSGWRRSRCFFPYAYSEVISKRSTLEHPFASKCGISRVVRRMPCKFCMSGLYSTNSPLIVVPRLLSGSRSILCIRHPSPGAKSPTGTVTARDFGMRSRGAMWFSFVILCTNALTGVGHWVVAPNYSFKRTAATGCATIVQRSAAAA